MRKITFHDGWTKGLDKLTVHVPVSPEFVIKTKRFSFKVFINVVSAPDKYCPKLLHAFKGCHRVTEYNKQKSSNDMFDVMVCVIRASVVAKLKSGGSSAVDHAGSTPSGGDVVAKTSQLCKALILAANATFEDNLSCDFSLPNVKKQFKGDHLPTDAKGRISFPCAEVNVNPRELTPPVEHHMLIKHDREMCLHHLRAQGWTPDTSVQCSEAQVVTKAATEVCPRPKPHPNPNPHPNPHPHLQLHSYRHPP